MVEFYEVSGSMSMRIAPTAASPLYLRKSYAFPKLVELQCGYAGDTANH
ncbi:MAG: hypothetical protein IT173_18630 [Acidobacteria bacterium]|nr:hypothetical protein [Acidobacteriota bacterium]